MRRTLSAKTAAPATAAAKELLIVYGSQTGTAENFARMLGPLALKHGFKPVVCTMDDAVLRLSGSSAKVAPRAILCVCSTYGTGEFPSNAQHFASALEHGQLPGLKGVEFSILGLGNSHNDNFNAAAKALDKGLREAGAKSLVRMQLSCESTQGHDLNYRSWKRAVWAALGSSATAAASAGVPMTYSVPTVVGALEKDVPKVILPPGYAKAFVNHNLTLTAEGYEPRQHQVTFTVPTLEQVRRLGGRTATLLDNVLIMPRNPASLVERAVKRLGLGHPETVVEITPLEGSTPSYVDHRKMTQRALLRDVVDLSALPARSFLESLALVTADATQRAHMEDLANDVSAASEYDTRAKSGFTVMDALELATTAELSLEFLVSHAPRMQPRSYSLSRDNTDWKHDEFEFVFSVPVRTNAAGQVTHRGLTTTMLEDVQTHDDLYVKFQPSPGRTLPANGKPLVIVALGSGIGAARAMLQRRRIAKRAGAAVGPAVLYYGFRHAGKDCLFTEDLEALEKEGIVTVHRVASHDGASFTTPLDVMDASVGEAVGAAGEVLYCGLGGTVPYLVEAALRRCGVDTAALRRTGRYHEEFFTADADAENLIKLRDASSAAKTLTGRMGSDCSMFCMQCEQTFRGVGCHKVGVCGKTPRVAALQDLTVHVCKILGFYADALRRGGAPEDAEANRLTLGAMFSTLTNVNFDEPRFIAYLDELRTTIGRLEKSFEKHGIAKPGLPRGTLTLSAEGPSLGADDLVTLGKSVGVLTRFTEEKTQSPACIAEMLTYGLKGLAAYTDHSLMNHREDAAVYAFMHKALAFLLDPSKWSDLGAGLALCLECGQVNVASMGLLYQSNTTLGVPSPHQAPVKPKAGKAILVSGHDLIMMDKLLAACKKRGINVYTHGEMLPSHSYPKLVAHGNLAGHFGGAWMRQSVEFPHFPGPILMTTNCLTEPHDSYRSNLFTAGAVGWSGVKHLGDTAVELDVEPLIEAALRAKGFTEADKEFTYPDPVGQKRAAAYTVGFGHETILGAAPVILEEIKKGTITRFFLIGGCDGFEGNRSYYTDLVKELPPTCVVLTLGCGKFRVNHLADELGTIGSTGIPRVLDMGQCNDSFSAVQVALALAQALNCKVSDLPLSIVLSWFEQKAIAVLLSCLHLGLKPLHVGPSLPAFVTPEIVEVLVKQFGIKPTGDAKADLKEMLAAPGAS